MKDFKNYVTLNNGINMPSLGFGTFKAENGNTAINAVKEALKLGYRHIDTASFYGNEEGVGIGIKESNIPREEIFLTSKVWISDHGYDKTLKAFETSLSKLKTDYLDLYLIHWPQPLNKETWKALETLYKDNRIKSIGVSNFTIDHLKELFNYAEIIPAVNQVEFHPLLSQNELRQFCKKHSIQLEAWSPLMRGKIFEIPLLKELSEKYNKTISQIVLRWDLQMNVVTIPKSTTPSRIKENLDIFDFEITEEDIKRINELNKELRIGPNPTDMYNRLTIKK